jgi:CRISPR/Cas system CSM-associated protein Csm3 (group 7 of RAMP superfamily)
MLEHTSFTATLRLRSDLHIGTGDTAKLSQTRPGHRPTQRNENEVDPEVSLIARAADGTPIIPATALKGALRKALLAAGNDEDVQRLFGAIKHTEWDGDRPIDHGQAGLVWLRFAPMTEPPPSAGTRPFWCSKTKTLITTHVAIDRTTGTAADKNLFYVERVPDGAEFELRGVYTGARADAKQDLPIAFSALTREDGIAVGAGDKQGGGRITLHGTLRCSRRYFDADTGRIESERPFEIPVTAATANVGAAAEFTLTIFCRGPYLTIDPERPRDGNEIPAARRNDQTPLLPSSSLLGVLRTRAVWIARTTAGFNDCDDVERVLVTGADPEMLSHTERLFGIAGWRGLLRVVAIEAINNADCEKLPGVVIDRFSGGTLDSALYKTEVFARARFRITLRLDRRRWGNTKQWPSEADIELFHSLLRDLQNEGVRLGYGSNRGFGWFDVEKIEPKIPKPITPDPLRHGEDPR